MLRMSRLFVMLQEAIAWPRGSVVRAKLCPLAGQGVLNKFALLLPKEGGETGSC